MHIIELKNVTKTFGKTFALKDLSFAAKMGVSIILGPNGSGKSTLLKTIAGLYRPDSGSVKVLGVDPYSDLSVKSSISILTENYALYDFLTVRENIEFFGALYGMSRYESIESVRQLMEELDILDLLDFKVQTISRGTKQKVAFCRAVISNPQVLLLDESTAFLDAKSSNVIRNYIQRNANKKSIVFVTQRIDEATRMNGNIYVMKNGRIVTSTNLNGMYKSIMKGVVINIRLAKQVDLKYLKGIGDMIQNSSGKASLIKIKIDSYKDISRAVDFIRGKGIDIVGIDYSEPFIEKAMD
jgi:ABC-type multidrug transport system ATPase subunit